MWASAVATHVAHGCGEDRFLPDALCLALASASTYHGGSLLGALGRAELCSDFLGDWTDVADWSKASLHFNVPRFVLILAGTNPEKIDFIDSVFDATDSEEPLTVQPLIDKRLC
jgi:hypothetical protein